MIKLSFNEWKTSDLMHPILHGSVTHALVERVGGQDQNEVTCSLYALNQLVLEFTGLQLLHIYEDAISSNLQVHLQKAWVRAGKEGRVKNFEARVK